MRALDGWALGWGAVGLWPVPCRVGRGGTSSPGKCSIRNPELVRGTAYTVVQLYYVVPVAAEYSITALHLRYICGGGDMLLSA